MLTQPAIPPQQAPLPGQPAPTAKQPPLWTADEFIQLSARVAAEPERVRAAVDLFQARLVSFGMLKQLLDIEP